MYLGLYTVCLGNMPLKQKAEWASKNGFKGIEIACWPHVNDRDYSSCDIDVENFTKSQADEIKNYLNDFGLKISSLAYYDNNLHHIPEVRKKINDHLIKCIDAAVMLGCDTVGTFIGRNEDKNIEQNFDDFSNVFSKIVKYAEDRNIKIVIENCAMEGWQTEGMPGTISYTPELWQEMFRRVPNKNFGLNLDPSHLLFQQIDYIDVIPVFKDRIFHAHAKDVEVFKEKLKWYGIYNAKLSKDDSFWRFRMPGFGQVDWRKFITTLRENGYDGVVSIEHEDPVYQGNVEKVKEGLVIGKEYLDKLIY